MGDHRPVAPHSFANRTADGILDLSITRANGVRRPAEFEPVESPVDRHGGESAGNWFRPNSRGLLSTRGRGASADTEFSDHIKVDAIRVALPTAYARGVLGRGPVR
jgi:hypothetical protein